MRIGFAPWGETLGELVEAARAAEDAGADTVWVSELHRSATVTAAAVIAGTRRVRVGTAVALAFTRSPLTTALEALDLAELSGGRFVLGLGSGVRRLVEDWHDQPFDAPAARLRDTVEIVRLVAARAHLGEPLAYAGHRSLRMTGYRRPSAPVPFPIHLASVGPVMTRLAGEVGDGWISHELLSPAYLTDRVLPLLRAAGRSPEAVVSACCSVGPDALADARGTVGFYLPVRTYAPFFACAGFAAEHERAVADFRAGRPVTVPDAMTAALTLAGPPHEVAKRVAELPADSVKLAAPVHGLPPDRIRRAQAALIDLIGALR